MINVLITGVGGGVGQGILKSIKLIKDLDINIVCADMSFLASGLYGGNKVYLVPAASSHDYFEEICRICKENNIDYYFPGTDVELFACVNGAEKINEALGVKVIVSPYDVIDIADDKLKTVEFLKKNGFYYPTTYLPNEVDLDKIEYPVIVKPRVGCRSIGVQLVHSKEEAIIAMDSVSSPIIQEYINGDEYTCTVAVSGETISDVLCLKRDLRSGDTFRAFPVKNEVIENYVRNIASSIGIQGSCNFQLRMDGNIPKLFEINSRFSGTTPFCSYLGFNPVEFCLKGDLGIPYNYHINYDKVVVRHWTEVVIDKEELDSISSNGFGEIRSAVVSKIV